MTVDVSRLGPRDVEAALRSYPRRFTAALAPLDDDEAVEELAQQLGPDGASAADHALDAVRTWTLLDDALRRIRDIDDAVVHRAVADPSERVWEHPGREPLPRVLEELDDAATGLASTVAGLPGGDWDRRAEVAGGGEVSALDVARDAVRVGHDQLVAVERTLEAVRRR